MRGSLLRVFSSDIKFRHEVMRGCQYVVQLRLKLTMVVSFLLCSVGVLRALCDVAPVLHTGISVMQFYGLYRRYCGKAFETAVLFRRFLRCTY